MIKFINVTKKYKGLIALNNINLELPESGLVIIRGANGAGKSTLVNLIGTLDTPTSGNIYINNVEITKLNEQELSKFREENISFIFQDNNLFDELTTRENINIVKESDKLKSIVDKLEISSLLDVKAKNLSGGEQKRVAVARVFMKNAKILIADEPTESLDNESKSKTFDFLKKISNDHLVVLVTHDNISVDPDVIIELDKGSVKEIINNSNLTISNNIMPSKCNFNPFKLSLNNLLTNKKNIFRNCLLLMISFLFIMFTTNIATTETVSLHVDTMVRKKMV